MTGFLFGIISALSFGSADFLAGLSSRKISVYATLYFMQAVGFLFLTATILMTGEWHKLLTHPFSIVEAAIWMAIDLIGILFLYQGLLRGNISVVAPITSSFSSVTVIIALFFGERPGLITLIGVAFTLIGVVLTSLQFTKHSGNHNKLASGVTWAVLASLFLGTAFWGIRFPSEEIGAVSTVWVGRLEAVILLPFVFFLIKHPLSKPSLNHWKLLIPIGVLDATALVSYNYGLTLTQTSIVVTGASLFAVVTILWGVFLMKEKLQWNQWLGIAVILTGIILITM